MGQKERNQLDDTELRRQTQVRESLGQRPSGVTDDQWCEQVVDCGEAHGNAKHGNLQRENMRGKSDELPPRDSVSDLDPTE